jgi:hypothetical protein
MDLLTFIAEILKAAAWPAVVLVAVIILRRELRSLVPLITSFKYKDLEVTFGREAAAVREEAAQLQTPSGALLPAGPAISETVRRLLPASPRAAIIEAWREVEEEARNAAERRNVALPQLRTVSQSRLLHALSSHAAVTSEQLALLHDLRSLRNQAAHAPEFALSEDSARDYAVAAAQLAQHLRAA